jgi:phage terminase large subunit-like protein
VNKINLLIDGAKENKVWYNNITEFNPSKSKNDDEVDVLSELIKRM